jgi:hypothetical protein
MYAAIVVFLLTEPRWRGTALWPEPWTTLWMPFHKSLRKRCAPTCAVLRESNPIFLIVEPPKISPCSVPTPSRIFQITSITTHHYTGSSDIAATVKMLPKATIPIPNPPAAQKIERTMKADKRGGIMQEVEVKLKGKVDKVNLYIWQDAYSTAQMHAQNYQELKKKAYNLICGIQCSLSLSTSLEGHKDYTVVQQSMDAMDLLLIVKGFCCKFDSTSQPIMLAMVKASFKILYTFYQ